MSRVEDPQLITRLIEGLDGDYHDGENVFIAVEPGGYGSTQASCWVTITDADTSVTQRYLVRADLEETGDEE